jgi:curved DNA-binding protein CbpA
VRIPLDYYRILGVPIQATNEQLSQAHGDRSLQLPRREYSDMAIAARKQLLDKAWKVLSDPQQRAEYDLQFLESVTEKNEPIEPEDQLSTLETETAQKTVFAPYTPYLEIAPQQFIGAMLILQELGEYHLVIELGTAHLASLESENEQILRGDIALTIALAYLELSREQWQRREYENAASSGSKGLELLEKKNLFANVREEIRTDLYRLRPYRILELLALGRDKVLERRTGLQLLKEMLQARQGIDGKGDDCSGLSVDNCLRFIQQIRVYLTAQEQQELFETEAERPSAVAKYLAVYALIARGFAHKQPALIVRAREFLKQLSQRQDVYLEQAVCALLLGQTQEASQALEGSQEKETLVFIKQQSEGAPDLLPGLCAYGERWLQTEVFSHFRDLATQKASLKDYFGDAEVEAYLDEWSANPQIEEQQIKNNDRAIEGEMMAKTRTGRKQSLQERKSQRTYEPVSNRSQYYNGQELPPTSSGRTATLAVPLKTPSQLQQITQFRDYGRDSSNFSDDRGVVPASRHSTVAPPRRRRGGVGGTLARVPQTKKRSRSSLKLRRLLLVIALLFSGVGAMGMLFKWVQDARSPLTALSGEQLLLELNRPPIEIPSANATVMSTEVLSEQGAEDAIATWLANKNLAFGKAHQVEKLDDILTGTLLSQWRDRAQTLKLGGDYWQYEHDLKILSLKTDTQNPDLAIVDASVREVANYYQGGQLDRGRSYNENLQVRYELVRQQEQWLIKSIKVID